MKAEWIEYLKTIGIKDLFLDRCKEIFNFYQQIYPDQIKDIFVTEYLDKEGNRQYESMWFFSETMVMEAKKFLEKDDFDSVPLNKQVKYWSVTKTEYDFIRATTKSRMVIKFGLLSGIGGSLKASRENCDSLKSIFIKYIITNTMECTVIAQQEGVE